jgi:transmembrane sensor
LEDKPDRRGHWWLGLAASLVLGVISLFAPLPQFQAEKNGTATGQAEPIEFVQAGGEVQYRTSKGQRLNFTLPDGTTVVMNTDSALTVAYSRGQRLVRLSRGQAFFEVVKNRTRPFVVLAGSKEVMALGTAFEVQVEGGRTHVLLVEGKVAVQPAMHGTDLSAAPAHVLMPGQKLVSDASNETLIRVNVDQAMLWQDGFVEFDDEPLISAVQEMNRYATHPLVIADNRAAFLRLSGIFKTGHTERFVHTISEILPVASRRGSGGIEIVLEVEGD